MARMEEPKPRWEKWVGILVGIGMLATAGYAFVETFWG